MRFPVFGALDYMNFLEGVSMHVFLRACALCVCVCLYRQCVYIIVFSAWLDVPVSACVHVAQDPSTSVRLMSFRSPVQFPLKSGSKDKKNNPYPM